MLLTLMITSKGIAGVPRASLVVIAATLSQFNIPEAGLLLILAVDHFLDMGRSATNVVGNAVASAVVARWEGALDPLEPAEIEPPHAPAPPAEPPPPESLGDARDRRDRAAAGLAGLPRLRRRGPRAQHRAGRGHDLRHRQRRARRAAGRDRRGAWASAPATLVHICAAMLGPVGDPRLVAGGVRPDQMGRRGLSAVDRLLAGPRRGSGRRSAAAAGRGAAVPLGDAGQHPQPQGRLVLPRLPAAIRRSGGGDAAGCRSSASACGSISSGRWSTSPSRSPRRGRRRGCGTWPGSAGRRAGWRRRRSARSRSSSPWRRAVTHRRRGRPSSALRNKPGGRGCARASRRGCG